MIITHSYKSSLQLPGNPSYEQLDQTIINGIAKLEGVSAPEVLKKDVTDLVNSILDGWNINHSHEDQLQCDVMDGC